MPDDYRLVRVIECEVYTRVVGYYRPAQQFNKGKKLEFEQRVPVRMGSPDDWPPSVLPDSRHPDEVARAAFEGTPTPVCVVRDQQGH